MRVAVFSTKNYDRAYLVAESLCHGHDSSGLFDHACHGYPTEHVRVAVFDGFPAVCVFVHDTLDLTTLAASAAGGVRLVALRSAGFNNVDLAAAADLGIVVCRVPAYSPHAVAEYAVAQILATVRHIPRAYARVRDGNFSLEGLLGFDLHGRTVGIVGTGRIGQVFARIMAGFGCRLLAYDPYPNDDVRALATYVSLEELFRGSDIIALHAPLTPQTYHLVDRAAIATMRRGVTIVNTSRGALVDTEAVIDALKDGTIGYLGLDVYEEEDALFFEDLSAEVIQDDTFARLLTFPNVLVTAHQAFFTDDAMRSIAETTLANITAFETRAILFIQSWRSHGPDRARARDGRFSRCSRRGLSSLRPSRTLPWDAGRLGWCPAERRNDRCSGPWPLEHLSCWAWRSSVCPRRRGRWQRLRQPRRERRPLRSGSPPMTAHASSRSRPSTRARAT